MSTIAIVYWSGSGNTEKMAEAICTGIKTAGMTAELFSVERFSLENAVVYDGFAFGCPSMGSEVLEESVFEPFFVAMESSLKEKPVVLFGSYGWGDGEWMRDWEERTRHCGAKVFQTCIVQGMPDDADIKDCQAAGKAFAQDCLSV